MRPFLLPDLGEGLHEAEIVEWHVKAGDAVKADAALVSVETDKAVVELPAPWTGKISRLCAKVGERVPVGAAVVEYEGGGEAEAKPSAPAPAAPVVQPARQAASRPRAMPAVRLLAEELGVDLASLSGTGPGGAITAKDVARALKASGAPEPDGWEPLRGPRRSMADAMEKAREVMPATVFDEVDISGWSAGQALMPRLVRAVCKAATAEPALNAWYDPARGRKVHAHVDLGIAVDTPAGLLVPVLRNAGAFSGDDLKRALDRLIAAAHARTLPPEDLKGATFTLSNYGSLAGRHATPVVVPPQVAILGVGRAFASADHRMLPLSQTIDHRAVTGGESARFLAAVMGDLALPG